MAGLQGAGQFNLFVIARPKVSHVGYAASDRLRQSMQRFLLYERLHILEGGVDQGGVSDQSEFHDESPASWVV